jgi:hypothetical protein
MNQTEFTLIVSSEPMDRDWMRSFIKPKIERGLEDLQQAIANKNGKPPKKLRACVEVHEALYLVWREPIILSELELARRCPSLGAHEVFEARIPDKRKMDTTLRKIRECVEIMRKQYGQPILSTAAVKQKDEELKQAGYWFARSRAEADKYFKKAEREVRAVIQSRIETFDSLRATFGHKDDPFQDVKEAL